jgi:class 3 adenylate cyclase/predicted ATPase
MHCSKCGIDNPPDASFCEHCGSRLEILCPSCKSPVTAGARFCKKCGTSLTARTPDAYPKDGPNAQRAAQPLKIRESADAPPDGERKTVTALFADIKGSMELMEDLDPEEARAIIDPALKLMIDAAHRYDGYIVQSTGDGIFALFGAPVAHEDHPQRALYAALRMQEDFRRYSDQLRSEGKPPVQVRVGVNTGDAVVRTIRTDEAHTEYTPIGHSTGLASRMQALAPVGSIAATEATRKLCEGYFIFKSLGTTRVKGVSEPVPVFEVTGLGPLRTRLQRSAGRGLSKFVGRAREMESLARAAQQARSGHGQIVAAIAEAGVGKSRLFYEFKATSQSGWMVLETFSVSHGKASAYLPIIELLHGYFGIAAGDDSRKRREKIAGKIAILDRTLEDTLPYLFALCGLAEGNDPVAGMDVQVRKRRTLDAIKRMVLRESLDQPLMVVFEDLHWIDEQTQEFLNLLADSIGTAKILLLVNYRPEYSHQWGSKTYYTQLRLDPLGKESAEEMLSALLGDSAELAMLKRVIVERTEGNPFFMEETVQVLQDERALVNEGGTLKLVRPLGELKIPPTVQAILSARIDRLPAAEKDLLQTLAVLGKEFALPLIRRVAGKPADEIDSMLGDLQLAEFIYEQPALSDPEYVFKHALTQDVAYNSVLIERRRTLHERAAAAIETLFADHLDDHLTELAHHYGRSGNAPKAIEYLAQSAKQAMQRSAYREAAASLTRALELTEKLPDDSDRNRQALKLQTDLVECAAALTGPSSAQCRGEIERALHLAEKLQDTHETFKALNALQPSYLISLELQRAREIADRTLAIADSEADEMMRATAHGAIGNVLIYQGRFRDSQEHLQRAIATADAQKAWPGFFSSFPQPLALSVVGWNLWFLGYPDQARDYAGQSMAIARNQPSGFLLAASTMWNLRVYICLRDSGVRDRSGQLAALADERGYAALAPLGHLFHGWALATQGDIDAGVEEMENNYQGLLRLSPGPTYMQVLYAEAYCRAGRHDEGLRRVEDTLRMSDETGERTARAELHRLKGELLLSRNPSDDAEAEREFRTALEVSREQKAKSWELRAATSFAKMLARQGRRDEARAMLSAIYGWFTEGFDTPDLKDAKAVLDDLA